MDDVALARWQGMIDERTGRSVERLDTINGDVREIKVALIKLSDDAAASSAARREWEPVLKQLATADAVQEGIAAILTQKKTAGLTQWQKYAAGAGILAVFVNLALRVLGVGSL